MAAKNDSPKIKDVYDIVAGLEEKFTSRLNRTEDSLKNEIFASRKEYREKIHYLERRDWVAGTITLILVGILSIGFSLLKIAL